MADPGKSARAKDWNRALRKAVTENRDEEASHAIDMGANIHKDALVIASEKGYVKMVEMLLAKGANVHTDGGRAFIQACKFSHAPVSELLCKHGNHTSYGSKWLNTLAEVSSQQPDIRIVALILKLHRDAITNRYDRIQEERRYVNTTDRLRLTTKAGEQSIAAVYGKITDEIKKCRGFKRCFDDDEEEKTPPEQLPNRNDTAKIFTQVELLLKQVMIERRTMVVNIVKMAKEMVEIFNVNIICHSKCTGKTHTEMKAALQTHMEELQTKISHILNLCLQYCKQPDERDKGR